MDSTTYLFLFALCLGAFLASCFLTYLIRRYALAKSLIDVPNARSSHSIPTPRGGGVSIVIVFLLPVLLFWIVSAFDTSDCGGVSNTMLWKGVTALLALCAVAGIGFWDDHKHIPARWRLFVHFSASLLAIFSMMPFAKVEVFGFALTNQWLLGGLGLFGLVWLLNLYNFMDGIDGIASVEAITVSLGAAALLFFQNMGEFSFGLVLFASTIAGFLVWNYPHAKIFMGDACSGFLGFSLGLFALISSNSVSIWSWIILLSVFITDATFTLIKRILNKEVWYDAHSSHAYQHYARNLIQYFQQQGYEPQQARTKSHRRVNFHMTLINVGWLLPLAAAAMFYPYWAFLITVIAYLPLIVIAHKLKAGISE